MLRLTEETIDAIEAEAAKVEWSDDMLHELGPDRELGMYMLPELLKLLGEGIELAESVRHIPMTRREKRGLVNLMIQSLTARDQMAVEPHTSKVIAHAFGHGKELFKAWGIA